MLIGVPAGKPLRFTTKVAVAAVTLPALSFVVTIVTVAVPVPVASRRRSAGTSFAGDSVAVNVGLVGVVGDVDDELPQPAAHTPRATTAGRTSVSSDNSFSGTRSEELAGQVEPEREVFRDAAVRDLPEGGPGPCSRTSARRRGAPTRFSIANAYSRVADREAADPRRHLERRRSAALLRRRRPPRPMKPVFRVSEPPVPVLCTHIGVDVERQAIAERARHTAPSAGAKLAWAPPSVLWKLFSPSTETMAENADRDRRRSGASRRTWPRTGWSGRCSCAARSPRDASSRRSGTRGRCWRRCRGRTGCSSCVLEAVAAQVLVEPVRQMKIHRVRRQRQRRRQVDGHEVRLERPELRVVVIGRRRGRLSRGV